MELVTQVTVAESRENDTTGIANAIMDDYVLPYIQGYLATDVFVVIIENNTSSSQYALRKMVFIGKQYGYYAGGVLRGIAPNYAYRQIANNISTWCSQGSIIKVYRVKGV